MPKKRQRAEYQNEYHNRDGGASARHRKAKQRDQEDLVMFHIRRKVLLNVPVPESIKSKSCFSRVWAEYQKKLHENVQVTVDMG